MKTPLKAKSNSLQPATATATATALGTMAPQHSTITAFAPTADDIALRAYLNFQKHGAADDNDVSESLQVASELVAEEHLSATL